MSSYLFIDPYQQIDIKPHPDTLVINSETGHGIDRVRNFITWTSRKPFNRIYKIGFIQNAEKLGREAQNALLKTLEEPPNHTTICLTTRNPDNIIPTIQSRCFRITVNELLRQQIPNINHYDQWGSNFDVSEQPISGFIPPQIGSMASAFATAEEWSKKNREEVVEQLDEWIHYITDHEISNQYWFVDKILTTQKNLRHNTNIQLTLEVLFLELTGNLS